MSRLALADLPNEIFDHVFTFLAERELVQLLKVDWRTRELARHTINSVILAQPLGDFVNYSGLVDLYKRGSVCTLWRAAHEENLVSFIDLVRFEGFIHREGYFAIGFSSLELYVAGLAESGQYSEIYQEASGLVCDRDYIAEFPTSVLVGALRRVDWPVVSRALDVLDKNAANSWPLQSFVGGVMFDECIQVFTSEKKQWRLLERFLRICCKSGFSLGPELQNELNWMLHQPWDDDCTAWFNCMHQFSEIDDEFMRGILIRACECRNMPMFFALEARLSPDASGALYKNPAVVEAFEWLRTADSAP
jgi:hypothetical protein